jgi:predicted nucleic acid-binding protein
VIVLADSSPLITLARAQQFELLKEFYGKIVISREVHDEVAIAGAGLPGAAEIKGASWIRVEPAPPELSSKFAEALVGLGAGEKSVICLAAVLRADLVLIDEEKARRAAKRVGLSVAGSIAVLERGAQLGFVDDLRAVFVSLLDQGIRFDRGLLNQSLGRFGLAKLEK